LIRLNSDGSLDTTFSNTVLSVNPQGWGNYVYTVTKSDEGDIFVGGEWSINNPVTNESYGGPVKLNTNGSIDWSFYLKGGYIDNTKAIYAKNGTIVLFGRSSYYKGGAANYETGGILNLDTEGNVLQVFDEYHGLRAMSDSYMTICSDYEETVTGDLIVLGSFTKIRTVESGVPSNGTPIGEFAPGIAKFSVGTVKNYVRTTADTTPGVSFIKLSSDGSLSSILPSFGTSVNGPRRLKVLEDDKIILVGNFATYGGVDCPDSILVINPDGSINTTYDFGIGIQVWGQQGYVNDAIKVGNSIIVGGFYDRYYDPSVSVAPIFAIKHEVVDHTATFYREEYSNNRNQMYYLTLQKINGNITPEEEVELEACKAKFLATDHTKLSYSLWDGPIAKQMWTKICNETNNNWHGHFFWDYPVSELLDRWPADMTPAEALPGATTLNLSVAKTKPVTAGAPGDMVIIYDGPESGTWVWDPIANEWSKELYFRFFSGVMSMVPEITWNQKNQISKYVILEMRPFLFSGLYIPAFKLTTDGLINSEIAY
jgi:hypothetical protein